MLVIGVGAIPNTFGIEGVNENAFFLKVMILFFYIHVLYSIVHALVVADTK